jgi:hypothetical protein
MRMTEEGKFYSFNTEVWTPGFIFPYLTGLEPNAIYDLSREVVSDYLAFHALARREECSKLLADGLRKLGLVNEETGRLDPDSFAQYISQPKATKSKPFLLKSLRKVEAEGMVSTGVRMLMPLDEEELDEPAGE